MARDHSRLHAFIPSSPPVRNLLPSLRILRVALLCSLLPSLSSIEADARQTTAAPSSQSSAYSPDPRGNLAACQRPTLELQTSAGELRFELFPDAAPFAVARLLEMSTGDAGAAANPSPLHGLEWNWIRPHAEVMSAPIPGAVSWPLQLDARALGLDLQRIETAGEAMEVMQDEILRVHQRNKLQAPSERLASWLETWRTSRDAEFLIGTSRQELLEAFGFEFRQGLDSRSIARGSLVLRNDSPTTVEPRLMVVLGDRPEKTGQWMVVGRVIDGLDRLHELSLRPLADDFAKRGRPADPERIEAALTRCRNLAAPRGIREQDNTTIRIR